MILKQYYLSCLSQASYLIADEASGVAAIVDPRRDIEQYLEDAKAQGLSIRHVLLTHFHADFVAGHLELRERCGATIHLGARAQAEYAHEPMRDGESLSLGPSVKLSFLETPGHTPEGISILVFDAARDADKPQAVLTGDTLFIGDVGRPDLLASVGVTATELAGMLYDSLRSKLMTLPAETLVYPGHGAGSACGKNLSSETVSTIGAQLKLNHALQPMTREAFIALVADQAEAPRYFGFDADLNTRERGTLDDALAKSLEALPLERFLRLVGQGCQVIDTRENGLFAAAHLSGSINIALSGKYATWAGTVIAPTRHLLLICEPGKERESAMRLGRIGFDQVAGTLAGGFAALADRPELLSSLPRVSAEVLAQLLEQPDAPVVVDVRGVGEREGSSIPGSLSVPLPHLEERLAEIPRDRSIVVHCAGGFRSAIAGSMLQAHGYTRVTDLEGGMTAWQSHLKMTPRVN